jgi:hypothetical protein
VVWDRLGRVGYDVCVADVLVPTVIVRAGILDPTCPLALLLLYFVPFIPLSIPSIRHAHWHCRPSTVCVWVRGVSGLVIDGSLTRRLGLLGLDACMLDVIVLAVVILSLPLNRLPLTLPWLFGSRVCS